LRVTPFLPGLLLGLVALPVGTAFAQLNGPGRAQDSVSAMVIAAPPIVTGTQTVGEGGDCSRVTVNVSGDLTGAGDDGGGVDQVQFELWDDGSLKDSQVVDVPVGTTRSVNVTLSFLGLYLSGAPGVGVYLTELPGGGNLFFLDPFFPTDVVGVCPACGPAPASGCATAPKGTVKFQGHPTTPSKQKLLWQWKGGTAAL